MLGSCSVGEEEAEVRYSFCRIAVVLDVLNAELYLTIPWHT